MNEKKQQGFTLIEILLVIGIIAVLATVVFVALNPAKRFTDAQNERRLSDIETILTAVHQYIIDNKGVVPPEIDTNELMLGTANNGCTLSDVGGCNTQSDACVDLSSSLSRYLKSIPFDPKNGSSEATYYTIIKDDNGLITVRACGAEGDEISISR